MSKYIPYKPEILTINDQKGESGQISWASIFQDVNEDGYPDLWVANDLSKLELYINEKGRRFRKVDHVRSDNVGNWMSFSSGDFNGDLREDLFVANFGGGVYAHSYISADPQTMFRPIIGEGTVISRVINGYYDPRHIFVDGNSYMKTMENRVVYSEVLPPDTSLPQNIRDFTYLGDYGSEFDRNSIDACEFIWGTHVFDLQNDGALDIFVVGGLFGRGGGLLSLTGTNPGRLLVNVIEDQETLKWIDLTAEHHLFNIQELQYDRLKSEGYIYRKAPLQNWNKRDTVYSFDRSVWTTQGLNIQEKVTNHDMIQTAEAGQTVIAADLNADGFIDLILRNLGGYDSRASTSKNLKMKTQSGTAVLPSHDYNYPSLTNFEPGHSPVFMNTYSQNHWLKIRLIDDSEKTFNRDAIGAKIVVNDRYLRVKRATQGSHVSNQLSDVHFGLGRETAKKIRIEWPDKGRTVQELKFANYKNVTLAISKTKGLINTIN